MMPDDPLTQEERAYLLRLARQSLEQGTAGKPLPALDEASLTPRLRAPGAAFVTLTRHGMLRGCIGALEPYQGLAEDVREHAAAAATQDYRFPAVRPEETPEIEIEISRLTTPRPLEYSGPEDLLAKLRPNIDGVVLRDGDAPLHLPAAGVGESARCGGVPGAPVHENGRRPRLMAAQED